VKVKEKISKLKGLDNLAITFSRTELGDGMYFNTITNPALMTNTMIINAILPITKEDAAKTAFLSEYLGAVNANLRTEKKLQLKLSENYGAQIVSSVQKYGDSQLLTLNASSINDRFAIDGESVTANTAKILIDCFTNTLTENGAFEADLFALKRRELEEEIMTEINDKRTYAVKRAGRTFYKNEPAAVSPLGEAEDAAKLTADNTFSHYRKMLEKSLIEIYFTGQSAETAKKIADTIFIPAVSKIDRWFEGFLRYEKSPVKSTPERVTETLDVAQSKMVMAFKTPSEYVPGNQLLNAMFGGTPSSKLFLNVREKLSLCYYCTSYYNEYKGCFTVDSGVEAANAEKAENEILVQLKALQNGDFTDDEIDSAKKAVINSLRTVVDSANAISAWYFSRLFGGTPETPEQRITAIENVTKKDIIEAANLLKLDTVYLLTKGLK
jgi:predicted Zn-dependent peptidase